MKIKDIIFAITITNTVFLLSSCFGGKMTSSMSGGEVTGVGTGRGFTEPTPYGMTMVNRGSLRMGIDSNDSLWGNVAPVKEP